MLKSLEHISVYVGSNSSINHFIFQKSLLRDKKKEPPKHRFVYIYFVRCGGLLTKGAFDGNIGTWCEACFNCIGKHLSIQLDQSKIIIL